MDYLRLCITLWSGCFFRGVTCVWPMRRLSPVHFRPFFRIKWPNRIKCVGSSDFFSRINYFMPISHGRINGVPKKNPLGDKRGEYKLRQQKLKSSYNSSVDVTCRPHNRWKSGALPIWEWAYVKKWFLMLKPNSPDSKHPARRPRGLGRPKWSFLVPLGPFSFFFGLGTAPHPHAICFPFFSLGVLGKTYILLGNTLKPTLNM